MVALCANDMGYNSLGNPYTSAVMVAQDGPTRREFASLLSHGTTWSGMGMGLRADGTVEKLEPEVIYGTGIGK